MPKAKKTAPPKDIPAQVALLERFGVWTGRRPRGSWFTNDEGERRRADGSGQRMQMVYWLNSTECPVDLKRRIEEPTLLQWYYRNRMPDDVRLAIEQLLERAAPEPTFDGFKLAERYPYIHERSIRIDMSSPDALQQLSHLQSQEI